jgi:integrase
MAKGWLRRKKGKLMYCWYNANGNERSKVVGVAMLTDAEGWLRVGELGLDKLVNKPDPANATFGEVAIHYLASGKKRTGEDKAQSTKNVEQHIYDDYLQPRWGERVAKNIEPLEIQEWLDSLKRKLADTTRAKIRTVMSAIYRHGQKLGMIPRREENNPMKWVSCGTTSDYEAITVSPEEAFAIVERLPQFEGTLLTLVAVTAIRISEALGLRWGDILWDKLQIMIRRDWVNGKLGRPKSKSSKAPVEMNEALASILLAWRQETAYSKDSDFLFASFKMHGSQPRLGSMIVQRYIRPAALQEGVLRKLDDGTCVDKYGNKVIRFGFHNFRHALATFLIEKGHDPLVVQRMLRQSDVKMTMHYTHNSHKRREAQAQFMERFLPEGERVPKRVLEATQQN